MHGLSRRIVLSVLGLLVMAGLHVASAQGSDRLSAPSEIRPDTAYGRLGDWFVLRDLDGKALRLADLSGRVLFVNFWATWCAPCVEEMPTVADLAAALQGSSVAFLLISIDDDARDVRRFMKKHLLPTPAYFRGWRPGESTFTAGIVPATFIVNKEREIVYQHHGAASWNAEPVRRFLQELAVAKDDGTLTSKIDHP